MSSTEKTDAPTIAPGAKDEDDGDEADTPEIKILSKKEKEKLKKQREKVYFANDPVHTQGNLTSIS